MKQTTHKEDLLKEKNLTNGKTKCECGHVLIIPAYVNYMFCRVCGKKVTNQSRDHFKYVMLKKLDKSRERLFNKFKDASLYNKQEFEKRAHEYDNNVTDIVINEVYKDIVNYQVDTYGETLMHTDTWSNHNDIDKEKFNTRVRNRKKHQKESRGIKTKDAKLERWTER